MAKKRVTNFVWSQDGKRMIGRSFTVDDGEGDTQAQSDSDQIVTTKDITKTPRSYEAEQVMAEIAERCSAECGKRADYWRYRADCAENEIQRLQRKNAKKRDEIHFRRKNTLTFTAVTAVVGFILGVILGVAIVLENHGPTVTILGTVGAGIIYLVFGAIVAAASGFLCHDFVERGVHNREQQIHENDEIVEEIEAEKKDCITLSKHFRKISDDERRKSWYYRGLR